MDDELIAKATEEELLFIRETGALMMEHLHPLDPAKMGWPEMERVTYLDARSAGTMPPEIQQRVVDSMNLQIEIRRR